MPMKREQGLLDTFRIFVSLMLTGQSLESSDNNVKFPQRQCLFLLGTVKPCPGERVGTKMPRQLRIPCLQDLTMN